MIGVNPADLNPRHQSLLCDECCTGFTLDEYDDRHTDDYGLEFHADCCTGGDEDYPCNTESEVVTARARRQEKAHNDRRIEERRQDYSAYRENERRKTNRRGNT